MAVNRKLFTIEAFESFIANHPDQLFELINGEIIEKVPTAEHAHIAGIISGEFHLYLKQRPQIKARFGVESRFRPEGDTGNDRMPDVFLRYTNAPRVKKGPVSGMPDVAVEIKSPEDTYRAMREKANYYLQNGSQMVWLVYPDKQIVEIYQNEVDIRILQPGDVIEGGAVLPDFTLPVDDVFEE